MQNTSTAGQQYPSSNSQTADLADANHILFDRGVLDAFGHVSVRSTENSECFLLARNVAPALVQPEDILEFNLDGETTASRKVYLERFIHSEIYRARPEVMAVVHSHSAAVVPFSVVDQPLRPILHMAGFLAEGIGHFEIRDTLGTGTDLLVRNRQSGEDLAAALGPGSIVLMRGHGSVVVAQSLKLAVYRAIYTEVNARAQAEAMQLGNCTFLTQEEGAAAAKTNAEQIERAWEMWRMQARTRVRFGD